MTSVTDLAHGLKGAKFPLHKKDLVALAKKNAVSKDVLHSFEGLPEQEYHSVTEVEHAFKGSSHSHAPSHKGGSHK